MQYPVKRHRRPGRPGLGLRPVLPASLPPRHVRAAAILICVSPPASPPSRPASQQPEQINPAASIASSRRSATTGEANLARAVDQPQTRAPPSHARPAAILLQATPAPVPSCPARPLRASRLPPWRPSCLIPTRVPWLLLHGWRYYTAASAILMTITGDSLYILNNLHL